jgi:hypothetical protein
MVGPPPRSSIEILRSSTSQGSKALESAAVVVVVVVLVDVPGAESSLPAEERNASRPANKSSAPTPATMTHVNRLPITGAPVLCGKPDLIAALTQAFRL